MRQSQLFVKTIRQSPKDETSINAQFLIRAGFVDKLMAGVYTYLPLGFRVLKKIEAIIREEMNTLGAQEVLMPALHPKENWQITNRWGAEEMYKVKGDAKKEYGLGWTHEEIIVPLAKKFIKSWKDFPFAIYQIQDKFRNEPRAKSGILRTREFIMKDLYSFHTDEKSLDQYYEKVKQSYFKIFQRVGLSSKTYLTLASGGTFSKYSHEFQTITPAGEDTIYICPKCKIAINKEIVTGKPKCAECGSENLKKEKAIEVGNIFKLYEKYTKPFGFKFQTKDGAEKFVLMGCYGIGLGRVMGTIVEVHCDPKGIIWPQNVTPFRIHLLEIYDNQPEVRKEAEKIYSILESQNFEVLYDDRQISAGEKFNDADLIGIPIRLVISRKTLQKNCIELKWRHKKETEMIKNHNLIDRLKTLQS